jgi:hypothetical protein
MNRGLTLSLAISLTLAIPVRAANKPRAGTDTQNKVVWTNDDLARPYDLGPISIVGRLNDGTPKPEAVVGRLNDGTPKPEAVPQPYVKTQDPEWYAEQAARLRDEVERRKAQLARYLQAIEDARSLKGMTGGINFVEGTIGITPEAGIEILRQRVKEAQAERDALAELARRNDIPPGTLRGL